MNNQEWVLIDTETTGLVAPIYVVELGAQRMQGWDRMGPPFHKLLNQNQDIPPEAARVHGYTREILERDGFPAQDVYREFAAYVGGAPLVAYNLKYDFDDVLLPEWKRLGIKLIGTPGFCALKLAQRLLDPVPAGNCKLQTLRQFYRLPERGAHTAMGDVETVIDLMQTVLRPLAYERGLTSWDHIRAFSEEEYFPSRIAFGKYKGRDFRDALTNAELKSWLSWLASSSNERSSRMGAWYLSHLSDAIRDGVTPPLEPQPIRSDHVRRDDASPSSHGTDLVRHHDLEIKHLQMLVEQARVRLAELETGYTKDRRAVDQIQAKIFNLVKEQYHARDRIKLIVSYRRKFIDTMLKDGDEETEEVANEYEKAREETRTNYEHASAAADNQKTLSDEDKVALESLWKKLVKLFHPDRFANEPDKKKTYEHLTAAINHARDVGNIDLLREIADDPNGFILRQGWGELNLDDEAELNSLKRLYATLQMEIIHLLEMLSDLHESPDFELFTLTQKNERLIDEVATEQKNTLAAEIEALEAEAARLQAEIDTLTGTASHGIS